MAVRTCTACPYCDCSDNVGESRFTYVWGMDDLMNITPSDKVDAFMDESGSLHIHNRNAVKGRCVCPEGHSFEIEGYIPCTALNCEYSGTPEVLRVMPS